ncbi:MAG: type VI secretion system ATPase TssH, partial [Dehalococcoidia bacterium]
QIARLEVNVVAQRLTDRKVTLVVTDAAVALIAKEGFDPDFGARPLRRLIERKVENPLAREILAGAYQAGDVVTVDVVDGEFTFTRKAGEPEVVEATVA